MDCGISTTSNPKALDAERTMLEATGGAKTHLRSKVVKEKTKKPIIMRHWRNYRQAQETQNLPVEIPYRFKSDMPHQLEIIKQIVLEIYNAI